MAIRIKLTEEDLRYLEGQKKLKNLSLRRYNRINILLLLHRGKKQADIEEFLGADRVTVWRTKNRYREQGIEAALGEAARPGQPKKYGTDQEAELVALAYGPCPEGWKRWTVRLLTEALRPRPGFGTVNRESVRLALKKTNASPG